MANEYHDAQGRFCSKSDMQKAIAHLAASGDHEGVQKLIADLKAVEEKREKAKFTAKAQEDQTTFQISEDGIHRWYKGDLLHREDGPAVKYPDGNRAWYRNGLAHRTDGPAWEWARGYREWWGNGKLHREDGPAKERPDGTCSWWTDGQLYREDGPAIERPNGTCE